MTEETKDGTYTEYQIPIGKLNDSQQVVLALLLQEGALRMKELIMSTLEAKEEDLTKDQVLAVIAEIAPNVFEVGTDDSVEESPEQAD